MAEGSRCLLYCHQGAAEEEVNDGPEPFFPGSQRPTRTGDDFNPYDYNPGGGTVGLDGSNPFDKGGTVGL